MRPAYARLAALAAKDGGLARLAGEAGKTFRAYFCTAHLAAPDEANSDEAFSLELGRAIVGTACVQHWFREEAATLELLRSIAVADPVLSAVWEEAHRLRASDAELHAAADDLLRRHAKRADPSGFPSARIAGTAALYEGLVAAGDRKLRKRRGVFYTPWPLARFVVRSIDQRLRADCGLAAGLAEPDRSERRAVRVLDPGAGSGVFLTYIMRQVWETCQDDNGPEWQDYVTADLLPRLRGVELLPGAWALAHWVLGATLAEMGLRAIGPLKLPLACGDLLASPPVGPPATVVLGNPPFAGNSASGGRWIDDLLHGRSPSGTACGDYYSVAGEPLAERKHWLQDDYVKFFRFAHWQIEESGWGILGLVTNHGYLDNATFRGLRYSLAATFPRIDIVDLHGNAKRRERTPDGGPDRNLFGIEQGVAVGLFVRPPAERTPPAAVSHGDLWGDSSAKLAALAGETMATLAKQALIPASPHFRFVPHDNSPPAEYAAAWRLPDAMPVSSTAVVTARDGLVIARSREELIERIAALRDPAISDESIRARWLTRQRSPRHRAGNTRGWNLAAAREALRADERWQDHIISVAYRPFDRRFLYYSPAMVDWPRSDVMRHLLPGPSADGGSNVALVARRQSPAGEPACYFWVADGVVVDGLIRSDNCGSESVFPLFLRQPAGGKQPNFSPEFHRHVAAAIGRPTVSPRELAAYAYALFFSPEYRRRYSAALQTDFPRILLPRGPGLFDCLASLGQQLIDCHLLAAPFPNDAPQWFGPRLPGLAGGYPRWSDDRLYLAEETWLAPVAQEVWRYRIGTYQVCRKWLRDRRALAWGPSEAVPLIEMLATIRSSYNLQLAIDQAITDCGEWPTAFV